MVGAWIRDNRIPDHGFVCGVLGGGGVGGGPRGGDPDEYLFGVPGEEGGEVGGQGEFDMCVFFFFCGVVVRSSADAVGMS